MMRWSGRDLAELSRNVLARSGEAEAEIYLRASAHGYARFAIGDLGQHMDVIEPQAIVRVARGKRIAEASTTMLSEEALAKAVHDAARAAAFVPELDDFPGFLGADDRANEQDSTRMDGNAKFRFSEATAKVTAKERAERLLPAMSAIRARGLVSAGMLETRQVAEAVTTTRGCFRAHDATVANFKIWALETPGSGGAAGYGGHMHRDIEGLEIEPQTARAIRICEMSKKPTELEAGSYDVVMEPEALSELLEWLAAIGFAAPEIESGTSFMVGRMGEPITGQSITIEEDPTDASPLGFASPFDREGVLRKRISLIDRGVARGILYDRLHAVRARTSSTGSAVTPTFGSAGGIGPSALSFAGGSAKNTEELIAGMDRGLYICRLHYVNGLLEPKRAVMTGLTRDGCFLVEKGKIVRPVGNMRFTDSFLEALARADAMTSRRVAVPTWWSDSGACIVPAIRMRNFRFNGRSQVVPAFA